MVGSYFVRVLTSTSDTLKAFRKLAAWADELHLAYAWASSGQGGSAHWNALPLDKVARAVVGIQSFGTEPRCGSDSGNGGYGTAALTAREWGISG